MGGSATARGCLCWRLLQLMRRAATDCAGDAASTTKPSPINVSFSKGHLVGVSAVQRSCRTGVRVQQVGALAGAAAATQCRKAAEGAPAAAHSSSTLRKQEQQQLAARGSLLLGAGRRAAAASR